MPTTRADINDFLSCRRIALVGVSRNEKDFSRYLLRQLVARGYDVVPVNPAAKNVEGLMCFARVQDIRPGLDAALVMTAAKDTERVVRDCREAGITRVWMHRAGGQGAVSEAAVRFCRENKIRLVEGHCPLMFLPRAGFIHFVHGLVLKISGRYPAALPSSR